MFGMLLMGKCVSRLINCIDAGQKHTASLETRELLSKLAIRQIPNCRPSLNRRIGRINRYNFYDRYYAASHHSANDRSWNYSHALSRISLRCGQILALLSGRLAVRCPQNEVSIKW